MGSALSLTIRNFAGRGFILGRVLLERNLAILSWKILSRSFVLCCKSSNPPDLRRSQNIPVLFCQGTKFFFKTALIHGAGDSVSCPALDEKRRMTSDRGFAGTIYLNEARRSGSNRFSIYEAHTHTHTNTQTYVRSTAHTDWNSAAFVKFRVDK